MNLPNRATVAEAAQRLQGYVRETPVISYDFDGFSVPLKLEMLQYSGSFKARGATNKLLAHEIPPAGVIAASGGNHGLAVAHAATRLGVRVEILVPSITSDSKLTRLRNAGAEVTVAGDVYADALEVAFARQKETGAMAVHAYDDPLVVAGQGTTFRELDKQRPDLDTVLVAVGGGGLIGGAAAWFGGDVKLVGVETSTTNALAVALEAGIPTSVDVSGLAADALGATSVGEIPFALARQHVSEVVLVDDDDVRFAMRRLWDDLRLVTEPAGATALSALTSNAYLPEDGERVGVLVCGANIDPAAFHSIIQSA